MASFQPYLALVTPYLQNEHRALQTKSRACLLDYHKFSSHLRRCQHLALASPQLLLSGGPGHRLSGTRKAHLCVTVNMVEKVTACKGGQEKVRRGKVGKQFPQHITGTMECNSTIELVGRESWHHTKIIVPPCNTQPFGSPRLPGPTVLVGHQLCA